jgi:hypothetical protein
MSKTSLAVYASVKQSDTSNSASTLVERDTDKSINVGQVNCINVANTGCDTAAVSGTTTAAAGTTTSDAGVLPALAAAKVYDTSGADGTKGVRIHADDDIAGRTLFIGNGVSNQVLKIYPPSGGAINGASADAAFSTTSGRGATLVCKSAGVWRAF